jgi:hypothetical protein
MATLRQSDVPARDDKGVRHGNYFSANLFKYRHFRAQLLNCEVKRPQ